MITMEEIIINRGDIEKIYKADLALTLWRALKQFHGGSNPLYPDLESRELPNGDIRNPDVTVYRNEATGTKFVRSEEGRGTSVVDKEGIFGHKKWEYIQIPKGTVIPKALIITRDHYMPRKKCWHYSVSPNYDMPVEEFLAALDQLAKNARIKLKGKKHA